MVDLENEELFKQFSKLARYHKKPIMGSSYSVYANGKALFANDTGELFQKFKAVKKNSGIMR